MSRSGSPTSILKSPSNAPLVETRTSSARSGRGSASPVSFEPSAGTNQRAETPSLGSARGGSTKGTNSRSNSPILFENPQSPAGIDGMKGSSRPGTAGSGKHTPSYGSGKGSRSESPIFFPTTPITVELPTTVTSRTSSPLHDPYTNHFTEAEPFPMSTPMEKIAEDPASVSASDGDEVAVPDLVEPGEVPTADESAPAADEGVLAPEGGASVADDGAPVTEEDTPVTGEAMDSVNAPEATAVEVQEAAGAAGAAAAKAAAAKAPAIEEVVVNGAVPTWKLRSKRTGGILDRITTCLRNGQNEIDIAQLELEEWPQEMLIVTKVREIIGFKNKLTTIPSLSEFRFLEHLDLSRNALLSLDTMDIHHLVKLRYLDVSRNDLSKLPEGLTKCALLEKLICHRNRLEMFPEDMSWLRQLKTIDAAYNNIQKLGNVLEALSNLEDLNLSNNEALERGNSEGIVLMGPRTQRLYDKRSMFAAKTSRRAIIIRSLGVQQRVITREQELTQEGLR